MAVITPDSQNSMLSDMIVYLTALAVGAIFLIILCIAMLVPKYKKMAKKECKELKDQFMFNGTIKSLNVSWLKTSITGGKQIKLALSGSKYIQTS